MCQIIDTYGSSAVSNTGSEHASSFVLFFWRCISAAYGERAETVLVVAGVVCRIENLANQVKALVRRPGHYLPARGYDGCERHRCLGDFLWTLKECRCVKMVSGHPLMIGVAIGFGQAVEFKAVY